MMRKNWINALIALALVSLLVAVLMLTGCKPKIEEQQPPLFNETINNQIESLTNTSTLPEEFVEFQYNYTPRNDSRYEIARDDIFTLSNGSFNSSEISFLGVVLGDSYESVIARLGIPDVLYMSADKSYKNLDYREKIGIGGIAPAITFHIENDTVTRITVKPPFKKYMQGNTTLGQTTESIYYMLDTPDYLSFSGSYRIFHYVEKGVDLYFRNKYVDRMSFTFPKEFKGVVYVTSPQVTAEGIIANVTEPVLVE